VTLICVFFRIKYHFDNIFVYRINCVTANEIRPSLRDTKLQQNNQTHHVGVSAILAVESAVERLYC